MRMQVSLITLILIYTAATEAQSPLPPPTNVSIQCDNYGVEVHWQYPPFNKDVLFQVVIKPDIWMRVENHTTSNLSLNISSMLGNPEFNSYFVTVTATSGLNKSKEAKSDRFSFNKYATSKITCQLDFPEVKLYPNDGKLHLQFSNPLHLYKNSPALRNVTDSLQYDVKTEEEENTFSCGLELKICETSIEFAEERKKYCVNLTGLIGQRELRPISECYEGDIKSYLFLFSVLGVVLMLLFIAGLLLLLAKELNKKITMKAASAFPKFLVKPTQTNLCKPLKLEAENVVREVQIVPLTYTGDPTEHAALLIEISNQDQSSDWPNSSVSSDHNCKNVRGSELEDVSSSGFNDLVKPESKMVSTSDLSAGYDCPHVTRQEMSPDDMVEVYGI
ncbi:interferon gamma receptor 1-like [Myxocyprinus asiaticus]|uniref:interferon gamma receptor 1-like n=1 Tax=Myxocyprinus asiaticus TaxID=70543 RepID=UPI0022216CEC|nr:interferon gamma receptor 1-like [Myxocyprinus asiaticus]